MKQALTSAESIGNSNKTYLSGNTIARSICDMGARRTAELPVYLF